MLQILRRVFDFTDHARNHPADPPPPDMLDASFDAQDQKINEIVVFVNGIRRADGVIANGIVSWDSLDTKLGKDLRGLVERATAAAFQVVTRAQGNVLEARSDTLSALQQANEAAGRATLAANEVVQARGTAMARVSRLMRQAETLLTQLRQAQTLLSTTENDYAGAAAEAEQWVKASQDWAEYMGNETGGELSINATIPPDTLAVMGITGDHWSSRWWANRADNAFGRLTDLYLGAWAEPPFTNLAGGDIETGSIYYDIDEGQPYVWNGSEWVPFWTPGRSVTSSLWYRAAAGQTVFDLKIPDQNGNNFIFDAVHPEGAEIHVNGIRLTPNYGPSAEADFAIDHTASTITLYRPLRVGDIFSADILMPPEKLAPGAVTVWRLKITPTIPDGTTTAFSLATVASGGPVVSVAKPEELLVSLDGVIQEPGVSYTALGSTITFTAAPEATAHLFFVWYQSSAPSGVTPPPPTITSPSTASVAENAAFSQTLTADKTVTWTKIGGADQALFTLAGAVLSMTAKDFELPTDADGNNTYVVQVRATDSSSGLTTSQTITVTVTNVVETVSYFDSFNRADANLEASLTASGGWAWTHDGLIAGALSIIGNQLRCNTFGDPGSVYKAPSLASPDHFVQFKVANIAAAGGPMIAARVTDRNNFIGCRVSSNSGNGSIQIFTNNANSYNPRYDSGAGACVVGDTLRMEVQGTAVRLYKNGTLTFTGTVGTLTASNFAGLVGRAAGVDPWIDDFQAGAL